MHVQTMEGLVGAKTNMDLINVPMRVFREARRRGDTAVMERALGYAGDFAGKAQEYEEIAREGMEKDAVEAREKAKAEQEKAIEKRRMEREDSEQKMREMMEDRANHIEADCEAVTLELSPEGKALSEEQNEKEVGITMSAVEQEQVCDTKTGEVSQNHSLFLSQQV